MIPKLRFPEFVGEWKEKRLGDIGEYIGGGTPNTSIKEYWQGNIPWISSSDISDDSIHKIAKTRFITKQAIEESATKIVPKGSVLMVSRVGIGKFAIADEELCASQDFTNLVTTENEYFLGYYFKAKSSVFLNISQGTSIKGFTTKDIKFAKFHFPKLPEQTKIATFLTAVDKRVNLLQKKKAELELYKKGVMQQLFSQAIRFKDDNGNDFPDWQEKKLGEVCKVQGGYAFKSSKFKENGIPVIRISNISNFNNFIDTSNLVYYDKFDNDENYVVRSGGLLIAMSGATTGKTSIFNLEGFAYVNQRVGLFKSISKDLFYQYITQYVLYDDFNNQLSSLLVAGAQPNISSSDIESIKIPFPHKDEQQKIADFLSAIDKSIEKLAAQISDSLLFKQGLLQRMFV